MHPVLDLTASDVLDASVMLFDLSPTKLVGRSRTSELVRARQIAWYVSHEHFRLSYPVIAREWRRDHTTVLYGVRRIAEMLSDGAPSVEARVLALKALVG